MMRWVNLRTNLPRFRMRVTRCKLLKLVIATVILIYIFLGTNIYTRITGYFQYGMFPCLGRPNIPNPGHSLPIEATIKCDTNFTGIRSTFTKGRLSDVKQTNSANITWSHNSSAVTLVAILAYMHTGSSYTGSLFSNHPGTYYFFEPLRSLQESTRKNAYITYLDGSKRKLFGNWTADDLAADAVHSLLHCKHEELDFDTLTKGYFTRNYKRGRDQIPYFKCVKTSRRPDVNTIKRCLHLLTDVCLNGSVRAFKFIRLPMRPVQELLRKNENLKFIYLVRDPRAMLDSQVRKNEMGTRVLKNFIRNTELFCQKMHTDFEIYKKFPQSIRDRIKLVRYEDLTDRPPEVTSRIFQFTEVAMLDSDRDYVKETTRKGNDSTRYNMDKWRQHLSQIRLDIINKHCSQVYEHFGYVHYSDLEDIRNSVKPTYT